MARGLTAKQDRFARLYATGNYTKTEAYERAGYMPNAKRVAKNVQASILSSRPAVAQAIREYQEQLLPLSTMRQEMEFALQNLKQLAALCPDPKVRLQASTQLFEFCAARLEEQPAKPPIDIENLIQQLIEFARAATPLDLETRTEAQFPRNPASRSSKSSVSRRGSVAKITAETSAMFYGFRQTPYLRGFFNIAPS
jgi:hypothetical protein